MEFLFTSGIQNNFSILHIVFNLILTLVLVGTATLVYRFTHRGLSYSQNFVSTLILLSMITTIMMMVIGNNLAVAFGLLGAFAIIRFRTVVKEVKDTTYIFFALSMGMAVGTGNYMIGIVGTTILLLVILLLHRFNFASTTTNDYLLVFHTRGSEDSPHSFADVFDKYLKSSMLLSSNSKDGGNIEHTYSIRFKDDSQNQKLVQSLSELQGIEDIHLISSKSDIEY